MKYWQRITRLVAFTAALSVWSNVVSGETAFKITASDAAEGDLLGSSVAIDGNFAVVGAPHKDFQMPEPAQFRIHLFSRLFADMTGVKDNHVGVIGGLDLNIPQRRQDIGHATRVVDVHLAAIGFYI